MHKPVPVSRVIVGEIVVLAALVTPFNYKAGLLILGLDLALITVAYLVQRH